MGQNIACRHNWLSIREETLYQNGLFFTLTHLS